MSYFNGNILYVCVDESEGACVGDLATIFNWQLEHEVPALRCMYYMVGEEVGFEDIVGDSK